MVANYASIDSTLLRKNVVIGAKELLVTFTTTIQFGQRLLIIPVLAVPNSVLCPVTAYRTMCKKVKATKSTSAFILPYKNQVQPVTYINFQQFLHRCIQSIGLNPAEFSSHSFRRGGTTWAFRSRVPGELIKIHGDWLSDAYLRHLDFSMDQRMDVTRILIEDLP